MPNKGIQAVFRLCFALLIPLVTLIHISLNKYKPGVHSIETPLDDLIPFVKYFAAPYLFMFAFILITLIYFAFADAETYFMFLVCDICGMLICFLIYFLFPTTVQRPDIHGNGLFSGLMRYIYSHDNPYNCFPSIHVLSSFLPILFSFRYGKSRFMKIFTLIFGVLISLSTMFVKQHFVLDAAASVVIGTILFLFFSNEKVWRKLPFKWIEEFPAVSSYDTDLE